MKNAQASGSASSGPSGGSVGDGAAVAKDAVLVKSHQIPQGTKECVGYDFNNGVNYDSMFKSFAQHGFQATHFSKAVDQINKMLSWRLSHENFDPTKEEPKLEDPKVRSSIRCKIFLGYTSNMVSCGNREVLRFLLEHKLVDCVVTTGGAIEEDIMKCFNPHYMGDFRLKGRDLRLKGFNRIGNLIVPNKNYIAFEDWFRPLLSKMLQEQQPQTNHITLTKTQLNKLTFKQTKGGIVISDSELKNECSDGLCVSVGSVVVGVDGKLVIDKNISQLNQIINTNLPTNKTTNTTTLTVIVPGEVWTPSKMIRRMGQHIDNKSSVLYWAYRNSIPVFCPAITDGAVGDVVFFHSYKQSGFVIDTAQDIKKINEMAMNAPKTGMLILGGGIVKHHICNANLMRNGADFSVFINTGQEFDGSDSGARPDEAISWGKIKIDADPVKVYGDASLLFPLIVSQTFAKLVEDRKKNNKQHDEQHDDDDDDDEQHDDDDDDDERNDDDDDERNDDDDDAKKQNSS